MHRGVKARLTAPTVREEWQMMLAGFQDMDRELAAYFDDFDGSAIVSLNPNRLWIRVNEPIRHVDDFDHAYSNWRVGDNYND